MEAIWIVPTVLGVIGVAGYAAAALLSRRFDRKYPHLSLKGLQEAEERARVSSAHMKRPSIPVPSFNPEEWRMQSARRDLESDRLDRSLAHLGEQVTRNPTRQDLPKSPARR